MGYEQVVAPTRREGMAIQPVFLDRAYDDPDLVVEAVKRTAPHRNIFAAEGVKMGQYYPLFRAFWCTGGKPAQEFLRPIVFNPNFIEAAKHAYDAAIIRPFRMVVNLSPPSPTTSAHTDFPTFRGIVTTPPTTWFLHHLGRSGLFKRWEVQIASGLAWFYTGEGGEFLYWPDGPDKPAQAERPPFWNRGMIGDNEYTFHQAAHVGRPENYMPKLGVDCALQWLDGRWHVVADGKSIASYTFEQVRISTLWKAYVFRDEQEEAAFEQHTDDLSIEMAVSILAEDLRKKGYRFDVPSDPINDPAWKALLYKAYPPPEVPADAQRLPAA